MIRWWKSLFAWRHVGDAGVWAYYDNTITGERRAVRTIIGGYSPKHTDWLDGGAWERTPPTPPTTESGVMPATDPRS